MNNEDVVVDNSNTTEEEVLETSQDGSDNLEERLAEEAEKRQKAEELAQNYKVRAEKAERLAKGVKPEVETVSKTSMSNKDFVSLVNAKVHEDDISEVEEYARFKNLSISDALKLSVVKTMLSEKEEMRKTASATNVKTTRTANTKVSGDALLEKARSGNVGEVDIEAIAQARFESKKNK